MRSARERVTCRDGQNRQGGKRWECTAGGRRFTARSTGIVSHNAFPDDVIALAVRWYIRYRLSDADVVEWFAERGITVDPSTVDDRVRAFTPRFIEVARRHLLWLPASSGLTAQLDGVMSCDTTAHGTLLRSAYSRRSFLRLCGRRRR